MDGQHSKPITGLSKSSSVLEALAVWTTRWQWVSLKLNFKPWALEPEYQALQASCWPTAVVFCVALASLQILQLMCSSSTLA